MMYKKVYAFVLLLGKKTELLFSPDKSFALELLIKLERKESAHELYLLEKRKKKRQKACKM